MTSPAPEAIQPPPTHCTDMMPEPAVDGKPESAMMHEPVPEKRTEPTIAQKPEPHKESGKVREPATLCVVVGQLVGYEGMEGTLC